MSDTGVAACFFWTLPHISGCDSHFVRVGFRIIEVSGRTYPVEVRYRPLADPDQPDIESRDQVQAIIDALAELRGEGPGDILVFFSGEREIRDAADALADEPDLEVLPLYARLEASFDLFFGVTQRL